MENESAPAAAESVLWQGRPSFWNWWVELFVGDLLVLLAAALWWTDRPRYAPWVLLGAVVSYAGVALLRLGGRYTITSQRVIAKRGFFAQRESEVEITDIRNITLEQSFLQRLVGMGDVGISSAGGEGVEVVFSGVSDAAAVKERIRAARQKSDGG